MELKKTPQENKINELIKANRIKRYSKNHYYQKNRCPYYKCACIFKTH